MRDWRLHGEQAGSDRTPIDRIVLYIDDLDRCSARQVVDVLQAVHLLLAMDLFVVVIGVDPRWLLNSLRGHYDPILDDTHERCASPEDYLEKIINIPFALPGMSSGKLRGLLRSIIEETETETRTASTGDTSLEPEPPRSGYVNDSGSIAIEAGSEVGGQRDPARQVRSPRPLTEPEIELLAALEVLITTPRQAKRLFNLYRMLRATRDLSEASRFLGADERPGEYQAVALLLGLLTADARRFGALLDASPGPTSEVRGGLLHRDPESRWGEFVADIEPRAVDEGRWTNGIVGTLPEDESGDWKRLHRGLVSASSSVTLTDLSALRSWAPVIRRFSYVPSTGSGSSNPDAG